MTMSNKQVIAIFIAGIAFLLCAFWAGLQVIKQEPMASASQPAADPPAQADKPVPAPNEGAGTNTLIDGARFLVQVGGSFGTAEKANQTVADLRRKYMSAYAQATEGEEKLYRVYIGPYDTPEAARQVANELEAEGIKGVTIISKTQE